MKFLRSLKLIYIFVFLFFSNSVAIEQTYTLPNIDSISEIKKELAKYLIEAKNSEGQLIHEGVAAVSTLSTGASAAIPTVVLPDISPKAFGVKKGETYIRALRDFARVLLMQHRYIKASLNFADTGEMYNNFAQFANKLRINAWNRMAWLEQTTEGCFVSNAEPDFFKTLQEIKLALRTNQKHELIVEAGDIRIFAATLKGIELLLKHRSLFMQNSINPEFGQNIQMHMDKQNSIDQKYVLYEPLINKIYQEAVHQENLEVQLLAVLLNLKLEQSKGRITILNNDKQRQAYLNDAIGTMHLVEQKYKLSPELLKYFDLVSKLISDFNQIMNRPLAMIPGIPTALKQGIIAEYNQTQPALYMAVRKELQEQAKNTNKGFLVKTEKGEILPLKLEPIGSTHPLPLEEAQQAAPSQPQILRVPQTQNKSGKTQKKKNKSNKKKNKQHEVVLLSVTSTDGSQSAQEQDALQADSSSAESVLEVQEIQPEVNFDARVCAEKSDAPLVAAEAQPVEVAAAPSSSTTRERHEVKEVATVGTEISAIQYMIPLLIEILDYNDNDDQVISAAEGATVVIDDRCNKMRLHLFQTEATKPIDYKPCYTENVTLWFESAKNAFSEQRYLDPLYEHDASTADAQYRVLCVHRFSKLVDRFIGTRGVMSSVPSRKPGHPDEIAITIPGYVEYYNSGTKPCLFVYYVNSTTGKCFHRNIQFKIGQKMIADFYKNGFFEVDQPPVDSQNH